MRSARRLVGASAASERRVAIAFPPDGAHLALAAPDGGRLPLTVRIEGDAADVVLLDGRPQAVPRSRRIATIRVPPGRPTLTVVTADGAAERVTFSAD